MSAAEPLEVDGSYGEGGGQILRTAVAFSAIQGRPVRVSRIRAGRRVPGLRQQHAATLHLLRDVFGGELTGANLGSSEVLFRPGGVGKSYVTLDMKTAASVTLLLQAVVPAVALSHTGIVLDLRGGTDVPWSPTFDYFAKVARPGYSLLGINFEVQAQRRGYYPKGGGRVLAEVKPAVRANSVDSVAPQGDVKVDLVSRCANLPRHVAERQLEAMAEVFRSKGIEVGSQTLSEEEADSPGSSVLASVNGGGRLLGADAIGEKGKRAEAVGGGAAETLASALEKGATVDTNLADMLAPLLSLSEAKSTLRVPSISLHLETGLYIARLFTGCEYSWDRDGETCLVHISPVPGHNT